jgi:glycosyltransferase involved in cell wall biosynthesis
MTVKEQSACISVLIPVYKPDPEWLRACIRSLNAQTYKDWQLVLSLDGEDPRTIDAIKIAQDNLALSHSLIVVRGAHSGITGALNRGLDVCETPYIARLDADDLCRTIRLQQQWQLMEQEPALVACGMQIQGIDSNGDQLRRRLHIYPTTPRLTLLVGALFNTPIAHPVLMFRTQAAKILGGYRHQPCMEDYDLMARLSGYGKLSNLNSVGLDYRVHEQQHSRQVRPKRRQLLAARYRFLLALIREQPAALALAGWPLVLYSIGPQGEYLLRRWISRRAAAFKS